MITQQIDELIQKGGIGILPTDTIYGIVGSALNPQVVEKIYKLRKRSLDKPMIILISDLNDLKKFDITLRNKQKEILEKIWPNPISVILACLSEKFEYLHRGKNSLAFRMPKDDSLLKLLKETGPLVVPSANFEGEKPAESIQEAKEYFAERLEFYVDEGILRSKPSTLIQFSDNEVEILREGIVSKEHIKKLLE